MLFGLGLALAMLPACSIFATKPTSQPRAVYKGVEMTARIEPSPLKLSDTRRAEILLTLKNRSSRFVRLEFPTTQRIEVLVRDAAGKQIVQWSEDQAFEAVPCSVGINPGEHLEYRAVIGTRDFIANRVHTVVASIAGYPKLTLEVPVTPRP